LQVTFGQKIKAIQFDTSYTPPEHREGLVHWHSDSTIEIGTKYAGTTLQSCHENVVLARNVSGDTITNGMAVAVVGAIGQYPTIVPALASNITGRTTIAIATNDIANNAIGPCCNSGTVNDINTSDFEDGDILYLSSSVSGYYQTEAPAAGNFSIILGVITYSHNNSGKLVVKVVAIPRLSYLSDVDVRDNPVSDHLLRYDFATNIYKQVCKTHEAHLVTSADLSNGYFSLAHNPISPIDVGCSIHNESTLLNKQIVGSTGATPDFDVLNTNELHISNNGAATGLSELIMAGDVLILRYMYNV